MAIAWKQIGDGTYKVSSEGMVVRIVGGRGSRITGMPLAMSIDSTGYYVVTLCVNGKRTTVRVHLLVARAFLTRPAETEVNHIDGNKLNNYLLNLEYVSRSENMLHAYRTGLNKGKRKKCA